jgi:glucose-1-phosphate thymidylyltransferase
VNAPTKAVVLAHEHSMASVANRALVGHALDWLAQGGVREAAVIVSEELAERARDAASGGRRNLSVSWLERLPDEPLAHVLGDLTGFLEGETFVLHLADSVARQSLRSLTAGGAKCDTEALLVIDGSRSAELAQVVQLRAAVGGGPAGPRPLRNDSAGVAVMSARVLEAAADVDAGPEHLLDALAARVEQRGGEVATCCVTDWWRFRGGTDALLEGNRFALEGRRPDYGLCQMADSTIQGAVIAHPDATIQSSVVRGPAIIGARARLRDAYVGPYTAIGEDVVIEGAEVEHSVVLAGAAISHLSGRLEASVIGRKSKVFRDFRLPRGLRLTVGDGAEVCLT